MTTSPNDLENPQADAHRFQFSLRTLLVVTALFAAVCSAVSVDSAWGLLVVLWFVTVGLPAALTTIVTYGRGYLRTFAIGAMFPATIIALIFAASLWDKTQSMMRFPVSRRYPTLIILSLGAFLTFWISLTVGVGLLAVWIRRLVEPPQ